MWIEAEKKSIKIWKNYVLQKWTGEKVLDELGCGLKKFREIKKKEKKLKKGLNDNNFFYFVMCYMYVL